MNNKLTVIFFTAIILLASGCETTQSSLFYWGSYEDLIYTMYHDPSEAPPARQIEKLSAEIAKAESRGLIVAPGIHAHLGMLYASIGNMSAAQQELTKEKILFPESATFIDQMLERARSNMNKRGS